MKICKNCGQQTDDGKVRCPHCGFLFEEDMDGVLREMKNNLQTYKSELASQPAPVQPAPVQSEAAPSQPVQAQQPAGQPAQAQPAGQPFASSRERFELLSEVAQLKGEMRVLQGEIERMHANNAGRSGQGTVAPVSVVYAQQPSASAPGQPAPGVYTHYAAPAQQLYAQQPYAHPYTQQPAPAYAYAARPAEKKRSTNRIVISILCILLLGLSIGMFFLPWVELAKDVGATGFQGILYIFDKKSEDIAEFAAMLAFIDMHEYAGGAKISEIIQKVCHYTVQWGVVVYAACLVLGIFQLLSLGGKIKARGWHRFWAWLSFIVALVLFGICCWTFGFKAITVWFLLGAGANFVRGLFLCFYKKGRRPEGGLQ